jgi:hypothetical protein
LVVRFALIGDDVGPSPGFAKVTAAGTIRYQNKEYTSLSTAAKAAAGGTSTTEWLAWSVTDEDQAILAALRDRHLKK